MKNRYWLIKRRGSYYAQDSITSKRESLKTKNKTEAQRLLVAKNEIARTPALNLQLGKIYLAGHDPKLVTRTWVHQAYAKKAEAICPPLEDYEGKIVPLVQPSILSLTPAKAQ